MANSQYNQRAPAADAEVREKIAAQAKQRVDRETAEQIAAASKRLQEEVLGPMDALLLDPTMIAAETTEKRFSMRIRLAGPDQLGGHTPRPQAPSDSLASVQIHESMLNNVLERSNWMARPSIWPDWAIGLPNGCIATSPSQSIRIRRT